MPYEIQRLLAGGGHMTVGKLAERLNTDPEIIRAGLEFLEHRGTIKKSGCGGKCCSRCGCGCGFALKPSQYWQAC